MTDPSLILLKLADLDNEIHRPFPYPDIHQMQKEFESHFSMLGGIITADFHDYCTTIAGTITYVRSGHQEDIQETQLALLPHTFFERFPEYAFLEEHLDRYPMFQSEYNLFEQARKLLVALFQFR
ncbi:YxiJ family protein [Brevibacillus dissolubilis]|uniref:YxiJ family protein n=1 Tax=Brevibacillus dissolubilis TaxID=1844116 RepID=UPI001116F872|nr:YxiJ family protein [Brevibacillus dissolubilis]